MNNGQSRTGASAGFTFIETLAAMLFMAIVIPVVVQALLIANRAGISKPVSPHVLRHTYSVSCVKKGISTRSLMQLLGHDHLSTTEIYLNLSPEDVIKEFESKW